MCTWLIFSEERFNFICTVSYSTATITVTMRLLQTHNLFIHARTCTRSLLIKMVTIMVTKRLLLLWFPGHLFPPPPLNPTCSHFNSSDLLAGCWSSLWTLRQQATFKNKTRLNLILYYSITMHAHVLEDHLLVWFFKNWCGVNLCVCALSGQRDHKFLEELGIDLHTFYSYDVV